MIHSSSASQVDGVSTPDYVNLVRFLVQPFLESPEVLRVDCEIAPGKSKVWIRLAFEGTDKGRVFGRGGRNIQAIRTVLQAAAQSVGHTAHLDIYGSEPSSEREGREVKGGQPEDKLEPTQVKRSDSLPKPLPKLRTQSPQ